MVFETANILPKLTRYHSKIQSDFYEVGAPMYRDKPLENLFSLRDAKRHTTLRRNIGAIYKKSVVWDLEPNIDRCVDEFLRQLAERTDHGPTNLNMSLWLHLFAFDCLSEVNVSKQLGFLQRGQDVEDMICSSDKIFAMVGLVCTLIITSFAITDGCDQFTQAPILQWVLGWLRSLSPPEKSEPALAVCQNWCSKVENTLLTSEKFILREVHDRKTSSKTHTDILSRLLGVRDVYPDKLSVRDTTAAVFINMFVLSFTLSLRSFCSPPPLIFSTVKSFHH